MSPTRPLPTASPPPPTDLNPRPDPVLDFPDRPFGELKPADYDALGFLGGLEVHQQLATQKKLFCRCRAGIRTTNVHAEVLRHMRPTLSEMGEYDGTALMEFKTRKEIVYLLERSCSCTYEIDDTPPFPINEEAVKFAIEISKLYGLNLVSELQVMRKQYLDGSIPTGFQRTAMVGLGGEIPFTGSELGPGRPLRIRQLTLEEDSCREVSDIGHRVHFRTDRLGMPLVETVTEPDLLTPYDVAQGGRLLARVARLSGKSRRGAGSARQDVNISVAGSRRVEIKGVHYHRGLPRLVHNEAYRHLNLLRVREELRQRGLEGSLLEISRFESPLASNLVIDAFPVLRSSDYPALQDAIARREAVWAVRLPGFRGLLAHRTQPGIVFAQEISERVRVIACLTSSPFMVTSDTDAAALGEEWAALRQALRADDEDAIVVLWGPDDDLDTASREVLIRAADALIGVPSETRQGRPDGTTGFERILPGPERMYPDTDTPPLPIPDAWLEEIDAHLGEPPWVREEKYEKLGLSKDEAYELASTRWTLLFDELAPQTPACARRLALAFRKRLVHFWRERGELVVPDAARIAPLVRAIDEGRVRIEGLEPALDRLLREEDSNAQAIVEDFAIEEGDEARFEERITQLAARRNELRSDDSETILRWGMGRAMRPFLGKLDPTLVRARLVAAFEIEEVTA